MFNLPSFGIGFVVGFGTGFVSREIANASRDTLKPLAKEVVKTSMNAVDKGKEAVAHFSELVEDLIAEIRSDDKAAKQKTKRKGAKKASHETKAHKKPPAEVSTSDATAGA